MGLCGHHALVPPISGVLWLVAHLNGFNVLTAISHSSVYVFVELISLHNLSQEADG